MIVRLTNEFDIFDLFVHDANNPPGMNVLWLETIFNELADSHLNVPEYLCFLSEESTGRSRWSVVYLEDEYAEGVDYYNYLPDTRPQNAKEVKELLPARVVEIMNKINEEFVKE